ncbi:sulfotransferase [Rhodospirillales bacterium]|nr:sulfotransferase [Rhodospirillales bacterium]
MHIVLDSLSRNGTTLLAAILNSNPNAFCYRGFFHEPLGIPGLHDDWPNRMINSDFMSENTNPKIDIKRLLDVSFQIIVDNFQYQRFDKATWKTLLSWAATVSEGHEPQEFIDTLLDLIRRMHGADVACWRWNNAVFYFHQWVKRPNHKWLQIIRDPVKAAISREIIWGIKSDKWDFNNAQLQRSIGWSLRYAMAYEAIKDDPRFLNIYFEDLLAGREGYTLSKVRNFIGTSSNLFGSGLIGQDGKPYRKETSEVIDRKAGKLTPNIEPELSRKYEDDPRFERYQKAFSRHLRGHNLFSRYFG